MNNKERIHDVYYEFLCYSPIGKWVHNKIIVEWELDEQQFSELLFAGIPSEWRNILYCSHLFQKYGDLSNIPGFYKHVLGGFLLDISPQYENTGFLLPIRNPHKLITAIQVYRYVSDPRPFILRNRKEADRAAA